jgi:16S rRNA A1518/A1519 N6-dimethyltransferase RsmA/KsgA/DIM1 with predicted DNA glycosylase/AP lyase activity
MGESKNKKYSSRNSKRTDQIFLVDPTQLRYIQQILQKERGPFIEIGCGTGNITKVIPEPKIGYEMDTSFALNLQIFNNIIFEDFTKAEVNNSFRVLVSNLPFNKAFDILLGAAEKYTYLEKYYVILPEPLCEKIQQRTPLGFKIRSIFNIKLLEFIPRTCFKPKPNVDCRWVYLQPKSDVIDLNYLKFLSQIKRPLRKLRNNISLVNLENLDESKLKSLDKRIKDFTDQDLYEIYKCLSI